MLLYVCLFYFFMIAFFLGIYSSTALSLLYSIAWGSVDLLPHFWWFFALIFVVQSVFLFWAIWKIFDFPKWRREVARAS